MKRVLNLVYNSFMAIKTVVCSKDIGYDLVLNEVKKRFKDLEVEFLADCQGNSFIGIADGSGRLRVVFYGNVKFDAFIESLEIFFKGNFNVSDRVLDFIDVIDRDVNIKVFTTQSCGWCFPAIVKAVSFAYLSEHIRVEVFDCYSFPHLATQYNVITVPKTVVNDKVEFIGTKDDNEYFGYIIKSIEG